MKKLTILTGILNVACAAAWLAKAAADTRLGSSTLATEDVCYAVIWLLLSVSHIKRGLVERKKDNAADGKDEQSTKKVLLIVSSKLALLAAL